MDDITLTPFFDFILQILITIGVFIQSHKIVLYFIAVPIAFTVLCIIMDFLFDLGHVLDDINVKNTFAYKGYNKYQKEQAQLRKQEEAERKKREKEAIRAYKEADKSANPYKHTVTRWQDKDGNWHAKEVYTRRDTRQPDISERDLFSNNTKMTKSDIKKYKNLESYYLEAPEKKQSKKNIDIYVEDY